MANPSPSSAGSAAGTSKYAVSRPARKPVRPKSIARAAAELWRLCIHLTRHTFGIFDRMPNVQSGLTPTEPSGDVTEEMLTVCQQLASESEARQTKLETKAAGLLSLIAVVIPLAASAAVFIRQNEMSPVMATVTLALELLALLLFLIGLFASLRAVAVRGGSALFVDTVVDSVTDKVRTYSDDFFGRALLDDAVKRHVVCDHIADFVRGAQMFLVLGVLLTAVAAVPVLFSIRPERAAIEGTVSLDPTSLRMLQDGVKASATEVELHIRELESEIQSIKAEHSNAEIEARLDRLSSEVADMQRALKKQGAAKRSSK